MRITIYTRNDCVQCHATKRAIESRGLEFDLVNLDTQPEAIEELRVEKPRSAQTGPSKPNLELILGSPVDVQVVLGGTTMPVSVAI